MRNATENDLKGPKAGRATPAAALLLGGVVCKCYHPMLLLVVAFQVEAGKGQILHLI